MEATGQEVRVRDTMRDFQEDGKTAFDREYNPHRWSHYVTIGGAMAIMFVLIWAMSKISL